MFALAAAVPSSALATEAEWLVGAQTLAERELKEEEVSFDGGPITLSVPSFSLTIECKKVGGTGAILEGGTDELPILLSSCSAGSSGCTVSEPVTLEAESELVVATNLAYQELRPAGKGELLATIAFEGVKCTLPEEVNITGEVAGLDSLESHVSQPLTFSKEITEVENEESESEKLELQFAGKAAYLSGSIKLHAVGGLTGEAMTLVPESKLCEVLNAGTCPGGKNYLVNSAVKLENEVNMKFNYNKGTVVCGSSKLEGHTLADSGAPVPGRFTVANVTSCGACTVSSLGRPYFIGMYRRNFTGDGFIDVSRVELKIVCPAITCVFVAMPFQLAVEGHLTAPKAKKSAFTMSRVVDGSAAGCDTTATWEGEGGGGDIKYKILAPNPLFLTR
jgi:hypothetical protein